MLAAGNELSFDGRRVTGVAGVGLDVWLRLQRDDSILEDTVTELRWQRV